MSPHPRITAFLNELQKRIEHPLNVSYTEHEYYIEYFIAIRYTPQREQVFVLWYNHKAEGESFGWEKYSNGTSFFGFQ